MSTEATGLTKADIRALRTADCVCVHLGGNGPLVRAIKRKPYRSTDPFATDIEHVITAAEVGLATMRGSEELAAGRVKAFAMLNTYHSQHSHESCVFHTLREGDIVKFRFYPDAHSNGYMARAGLHGDTLYLDVRRKGKQVAQWELETSACPNNSARMVQGIPDSEDYKRNARECAA